MKVKISVEIKGVIEVMVMLMVIFRAMVSHVIEVLSLCWSEVVLGHGLGQGLGLH